ncbi:RAM signaling pathway protein-domain-containing protein [Bombardia bombarda]|uniref:RAM signaling pathway protein-domain-containing protein n=1 Tax=Bombardia bombarda TaxID=252184 RepID=A0AA39XL62_9PEZI|nr:RAM signaling pathway protein-domain-containing protein [Bombardia bombarda]
MEQPRGLPENPAHSRRNGSIGVPMGTPPPPAPAIRDKMSNSSLSTFAPPTSFQVINLAREAVRTAREREAQAAEANGMSSTVKTGLTIDLSRKKIRDLPDEIVDILKDELERLALSHNSLESLPARIAEWTSLRYLNVRHNKMKEFPLALCGLKSLEILDLGRNMLQVLPPEIIKLSSLKVLSLPKNRISRLPLCLADMPSLHVIKLEGNPLVFPPIEVTQLPATNGEENDVKLVYRTQHIKKFLKQHASSNNIINGRTDPDPPGTGEDSAEGIETPRPTIKRAFSGRFPIKVNGSDMPDLRSPALSRPPPIPTRSHYRGLSQQNTTQRRPGVMPLTIGNPNERVRSNSETTIQTSSRERSESRSRRMGIVSKKPELSTLDETEVNNRFSHYRGLSHGSAMQGNGATIIVKSPPLTSPSDSLHRPVYVRRLSILPERRRESKVFDPVLEAAKGILYSVFQIHPMIQMLMSLAGDGTDKRTSLELVFYNTNIHVEQLELEIQKHDVVTADGGFGPRENENVQRACITLVSAYNHVCSLLISNLDLFLDNGDPRYIRTLLTQLYNSIMELRVTCTQASSESSFRSNQYRPDITDNNTLRPHSHSRENSATPTFDRPLITGRPRNGTFVYTPSSLRVTTDVPMAYISGTGRTATISAATPRSGESFTSTSTSGARALNGDFNDEDRAFEKIFLSLQKSGDMVMRILPILNTQFNTSMRDAKAQRASEHVLQSWRTLIHKCSLAIQQTERLKEKLSSIKLKEPGIRTQGSFWALCGSFVDTWYMFAKRTSLYQNDLQLPTDTKVRLRPIHHSMKEMWDLVLASPWSFHARHYTSGGNSSSIGGGGVSTPLPMTPQSAALGPAVQATVPSTPQSASFAHAFSGNVFERADTLLSSMSGGMYNMGHRSGTMNSTSTASLNSISTLSSHDGSAIMTPSSSTASASAMMIGGGGPLPLPLRLNGGSSKVGGF